MVNFERMSVFYECDLWKSSGKSLISQKVKSFDKRTVDMKFP